MTCSGPGTLAQGVDQARLFFSADGTEFFASGRSDECSRWRILPGTNTTGSPRLESAQLPVPNGGASIALASNVVAFTSNRGSRMVLLENLATITPQWVPTSAGINGISPEGRWVGIYLPFSRLLNVYSLPGLQPVATLTNQANIWDFVFSPLGDQVVVSSHSGVEFWSTDTWMRTRVITNFTDMLFSRERSSWWLTSDCRSAGLYDATSLKPLLPLPTGTLPLALSPNGGFLAVSVDLRYLQVWDLAAVRHQLHDLGLDWEADL